MQRCKILYEERKDETSKLCKILKVLESPNNRL
jgi:hypothetical protein